MSAQSEAVARDVRRLVVDAAIEARTCHIGSSLSIVDVLSVLYTDILPAGREALPHRFLLSKGHAASALYATLAATGVLSREEMVNDYCADGGRLHGHPERGVPGVEMTAGSLGHGPAIAVGIALAERRQSGRRTYCLVGDGELNEGSVWEAIAIAGHLRLDSLTLIVDANGLQGLGPCSDVLDLDPLVTKLEAFGFAAQDVAGHDHEALAAALGARDGARPGAVVARTIKGYGVGWMEDDVMSHYRTLKPEDRPRVLADLELR